MQDAPFPPSPHSSFEPLEPRAADGQGPEALLPLGLWLLEGLRAAFFRRVRVAGKTPAPQQLLAILVLVAVAEVALMRLEIPGPAQFNLQAWLAGWWTTALGVGLAWWALPAAGTVPAADRAAARPGGVAAFLTLWLAAGLPPLLLAQGVIAAIAQGWVEAALFSVSWFYWVFYGVLILWGWAISVFLLLQFAGWTRRTQVVAAVLIAATGLTVWAFETRSWEQDHSRDIAAEDKRPRLQLSQPVFEQQQVLLANSLAGIAAQRPGVTDVYGLVFAPYAGEDVFLRESSLVSRILTERFDAAGRVVHLLNHGSTTTTHAWATPLNLQRAVAALAGRMDRDNDVLVVYLTSHGARDFRLAASHWPLEVDPVSPAELRAALDQAGIRHRVIAVSACYSGGWIDALAGESSLVMTAADATHTSYGCGRLSELTFFGRAMFDEQLRTTHSFEQAFAAAVPVIQQREVAAGKTDGFSNPQISVGEKIKPVLQALEQRLGGS